MKLLNRSERRPTVPSGAESRSAGGAAWRRRYRGEQPAHTATTAHLQAAYPFVAEGGLGGRGVYIGRDAYGGSFVYDPWELYGKELTSPNMAVLGMIGKAKSSFIKTYIWRQSIFGRHAWIIDPKGEYGPLAEALGVRPLALRPGGELRLNPITRKAGWNNQLRLLQAVAASALHRPPHPEEEAGLREALKVVNETVKEPTLPAIVEVLLRPVESMASALATTTRELAQATRQAALGLQRLCEGDLRGMFDGPTTPGIDLDARLVVVNLEAVYDSAALGILMTCATAWLRVMVDAQIEREKRTGESGKKLILVIDEAWRAFPHVGVGEWLQDSFKHCRRYGIQNIIVMHRLSDLRAAGADGSLAVKLAEGLLADAETRVIYAQAPDQLGDARALLALTDTEAELLPSLRRGEALWQVGQRSFLVQHRLSSFEAQLVNTDAQMTVHHRHAAQPSELIGQAA